VRRIHLVAAVATALLLTACGGALDPDAAPVSGLPDDAASGDGAADADDRDGDEGAAGGAAGMCLEGVEDCIDTPGVGLGEGDELVDPDIPIVDEPLDAYDLVEPRDVVDDRFPLFLQWATEDGTTLTVGYEVGVEPCFVTAEVVVSELEDVVSVTVLGGPDRDAGDVGCIDIAESKAVEVELSEPLGGRRLVDGSRATPADLGA
jgi:hypothetical protein